jgi:hypothetical protein
MFAVKVKGTPSLPPPRAMPGNSRSLRCSAAPS